MDINQAYELVQYIAQKDRGGYIPPATFNLLAKQGQWEYCNKVYAPMKLVRFPGNQKISDDLLPLQTTTQLQVDSGIATRPKDYWHFTSLQYVYFTDKSNIKRIDVLDNDAYTERLDSAIVFPTREYPICTFYDTFIKFAPFVSGQVQFDYLRKPGDTYWDYDIVSGRQVYRSAGQNIDNNTEYKGTTLIVPRVSQSKDFDLPEDTHSEIVMYILQNIGINIDNAILTQYSNAKATEGV